jgi:hypothetical protein
MGGFECSTHRRRDGRRLDVIAATGHDREALSDYALLMRCGLGVARDGLRWHLIERLPYRYDWSSLLPMLRAAKAARIQIVWDLMHYGWPDGLDIWSAAFVERFARFAREAARIITAESDDVPVLSVVNEISFMAWAGGTAGLFEPFRRRRGPELKRQLVRATIAAIDAIRSVAPGARFVQIDPLIHVVAHPTRPATRRRARMLRDAQYEAWDMVCGRASPELGGNESCLDLVGVNYYCHNQWVADGGPLDWRGDPRYRPLSELLIDIVGRYGRPVLIAETGIEGDLRVPWFDYVCEQAAAAEAGGVDMLGLCLYPVMNHPGWDDDRHCPNGLIDYDRDSLVRSLDAPLLAALRRQQGLRGQRSAA